MIIKRFEFSDKKTELSFGDRISVVPALKAAERYELLRGFAALVSDLSDPEIVQNTVEIETQGVPGILSYDYLSTHRIFDTVTRNYILSRDILNALVKKEVSIPEFNPKNVNVVKILKATPEGTIPELDVLRSLYAEKISSKKMLEEKVVHLDLDVRGLEREIENSKNLVQTYREILVAPLEDTENEKDNILKPLREQKESLIGQLENIQERIHSYKNSNLARLQELVDLATEEARDNANSMADYLLEIYNEVMEFEDQLNSKGIFINEALEDYSEKKKEYDDLLSRISGPDVSEKKKNELDSLHHHIKNYDAIYLNQKNPPTLESLELLEQEMLQEMGFETWSAYLMADQVAASDPWVVRQVEEAKVAFKKAEETWLRVSAEIQSLDGYLESLEYLNTLQVEAKMAVGYSLEENVPVEKLIAALRSSLVSSNEETPLSLALGGVISSFGITRPSGGDIAHMIRIGEHLLEDGSVQKMITDLELESLNIQNRIKETTERITLVENDLIGKKDGLLKKIAREKSLGGHFKKESENKSAEIQENFELIENLDNEIFALQRKINDIILEEAKRMHFEEFSYYAEAEPSDENKVSNFLFSLFASLRDVGEVGSIPVLFDDIFSELDESMCDYILRQIMVYSDVAQIVILSDAQIVARWISMNDSEQVALVKVEQILSPS